MKFDMHCHVKEGSIDSKVSLDEYITILKKHGFGGMLVTDHDTYKGYRHWKYDMKGKVHNDFVVMKVSIFCPFIICLLISKARLLSIPGFSDNI